ncbi:aspergillopepsin [Cubamyces lactineus]|nr:aspergillopepsin [Cubamyces lactineus]
MLFSSLLFQAVIAATAIAVPTSSERHAQRLARRAAGAHLSNPNRVISRPAAASDGTNTTQVEYSDNWAGAVLNADPNTFQSVTGTFVVPTPSVPPGGSPNGFYSSSAWVGIDGDTCQTAILQTGIDMSFNDGQVFYDAWYEWYPQYSYDFDDFEVSAGDEITTVVVATSLTSGTATIINHSTGQQVEHSFDLPDLPLCQQDAEWIVEDFEQGGLVPFANFDTVTFTDASAGTSASGEVGPAGANILDISQNGKVLTSSSVTESSVTVEYIGA